MMKTIISPSLLSADFSRLSEEIIHLAQAGADFLHIDVMDGAFVPNITLGPDIVKSIKGCSSIPLDVHLMIEHPERHVDAFIEAGADILTFHIEATNFSVRLLNYLRSSGVKSGIALVPGTPAGALEYLLEYVDLILVMSVDPGFAGQQFIESQLNKIVQIRKMIDKSGKDIHLAVDGGINEQTVRMVKKSGADFIIAGSYILGSGSSELYAERIEKLRNIV